MKRNASTWVKLENVVRDEINQPQRGTYYMIPFKETPKIGKLIETESRLGIARSQGVWVNNYRLSVCG